MIALWHNPFSTSRVRPGAVPYVFPDGSDVDALIERLRKNDWWGEIVGPHGSGKSTLLATLVPALERAGREVNCITLHDGQRRLPPEVVTAWRTAGPTVQFVIDGYEQLSRWSRFWLRSRCRRQGCGLLVTTHRPLGLPTLLSTATSPDLAWQLVTQLLSPAGPQLTRAEVDRAYHKHHGDLRETLFALYNICERSRVGQSSDQTA